MVYVHHDGAYTYTPTVFQISLIQAVTHRIDINY